MVAFCLSNWKKVTNLLKMVAIRVKAVAFVLKKPTSVQSLSGRRVVRGVGKQRGSRANLRCTRHFRSFLCVWLMFSFFFFVCRSDVKRWNSVGGM
jgi:hypothetical protein